MKLDIQKILIVGLSLVCLFIFWQGCNKSNELADFKTQIALLEKGEQVFWEKTDQDGKKIAEQSQVILTQKDAIEQGLLEIGRLKKVKSQVRVITKTEIDSVFVKFDPDTIPITDTSSNYIIVPKTFTLSDKWYNLSGTVLKGGLFIDTMGFINEQTITIGMQSNGWFKKPSPVVDVANQNPYTRVQGLNNVVIKEDLKFYDKKGFWFGSGVAVGILVPLLVK